MPSVRLGIFLGVVGSQSGASAEAAPLVRIEVVATCLNGAKEQCQRLHMLVLSAALP